MIPSCQQVAELLSENLDEPIKGFKRFKLITHLLMCRFCRRYKNQLAVTSKTIELADAQVIPSDEFKNEMIQVYQNCQCGKKH